MGDTKAGGLKISPILGFAAVIIVIAGLMTAKSIVIPILLALFISVICAQPILWLRHKKVPHGLAVLIILVIILLVFFGLGGLIGGSLSRFTKNAPVYAENLSNMAENLIEGLNQLGVSIPEDQTMDILDPGKVMSLAAVALQEIGSLMSNSFLILVIAIFMMAELSSFYIKSEVVAKTNNVSLEYLDKIGATIRHYLSIKTVISLITGVFVAVWLMIIGVDYPILWGVIAFLMNYIPTIGSIIAAVPTMLLALVQIGWGGLIWTGVGYLVINMIMGTGIEPRIMGKDLGLSTLVVFLSLIIWGYVFGTVGMFLSIPLTMTIKIVLEVNPDTKWIAMMLGTEEEAKKSLKNMKEES